MRQQWALILAVAIVAAGLVLSAFILRPSSAKQCTTVRFRAGSTQTCRP